MCIRDRSTVGRDDAGREVIAGLGGDDRRRRVAEQRGPDPAAAVRARDGEEAQLPATAHAGSREPALVLEDTHARRPGDTLAEALLLRDDGEVIRSVIG